MKTVSILIAGASALALAACSAEKPTQQLAAAESAVYDAQRSGAGETAPDTLTRAQQKLARAQLLAEEGEVEEAKLLAAEARADAEAARSAAKSSDAAMAEYEAAQAKAEAAILAEANSELMAELEAKETARGAVVTLGDVLFRTDSARLTPAGMDKVVEIAQVLRADPGQAVVIEGHADATGASAYNQALSEQRAESVAAALLSSGVQTPRIVFSGAGEDSPIASNATPLGRQLNRRVEVIFVTQK